MKLVEIHIQNKTWESTFVEICIDHTAERAVLVIARMSSFPVQIRGIESESWLNNIENLHAKFTFTLHKMDMKQNK
jgi:hypothetical protein